LFLKVDTNVTRHLKDELKKSDWDLMILHYLGLDHVGHIEGPFAPVNIKRKLFEMDEIVHKIYSSLNEDDLFIIVSDHGMANEGGHGGSSRMETLTPLVMISNSKFSDDKKLDDFELKKLFANIPTFEQVDLVRLNSKIKGSMSITHIYIELTHIGDTKNNFLSSYTLSTFLWAFYN